jgi:ribosomal protein RSM22 (predicted rRNA methylase)
MFSEKPPISLQKIADSVMRLSNHYIEKPEAETPWNEEFCQIAYRYYYLPLNYTRAQKVLSRAEQVQFFEGLTQFIDWGCGPATLSLAVAHDEEIKKQIRSQILFDISQRVLTNFSDLHSQLINPKPSTNLNLDHVGDVRNTALMFSYSLTELEALPKGWNNFEALVILEPSTGHDGRRLMGWREKIIGAGYNIWAPCTHHEACPLLTHSKNDWCHDRAFVHSPEWFMQLEQLLPMRNRTVTTSYLLARRKKPVELAKNTARLTGDSLEEKGKTRQLVCRGPNREFLTWMHKKISPQILARGDFFNIPEDVELKSNEIRINS